MNVAAAAFVLAPALALGSFLNVVVARVPVRRSILRPPSSCGSCGTEILWRDNIPVLSYALLRGRCRHCDASISLFYPAVEVLTTILIVSCFAVFDPTAEAVLAAAFCSVLVVLSVIDVNHRAVPNRVLLPAVAAILVAHTVIDPSPAWLAWALVASGVLFLVVLAYPEVIGTGEVRLALLLGAMLGASVTLGLMIGLFAALVPAAVLLSRHGGAARRVGVPLVPFLASGSVVALFFGDAILAASLRLF